MYLAAAVCVISARPTLGCVEATLAAQQRRHGARRTMRGFRVPKQEPRVVRLKMVLWSSLCLLWSLMYTFWFLCAFSDSYGIFHHPCVEVEIDRCVLRHRTRCRNLGSSQECCALLSVFVYPESLHLGIFCDLLLDSCQQGVKRESAEVEHVCACHSDESCDSEESYES
jgi:hypothetical protein